MTAVADIRLGQRLQIGKDRATVRYIGPVDGQSGDWVGLEWDDHARGKHDGCVNGRRYFICTSTDNAGSFVRLSKLQETARAGDSVLQGLHSRYKGAPGAAAAASDTVRFNLVGEQDVRIHQGQLDILDKASLNGACISSAGPDGELAAAAPRLWELDLSDCLLSSWDDAVHIMQQLPALRVLNLSHMPMAFPNARLSLPPCGTVSGLQTLVLNGCHLTWPQVLALEPSVPALRQLHLCSNGIASLGAGSNTICAQAFQQLQVLDLANNQLSSWDEVRELSHLTSLTALSLSRNSLQDAEQPLETGAALASLKALFCADNQISSWKTVEAFAQLGGLQELRLSGNPLLATAEDGERYQVIARMPGLTFLNGSVVDDVERRDAELHYLRTVVLQCGQDAALQAHHPRLAALQSKYGFMGDTVGKFTDVQIGFAPMESSMVTVCLTMVMEGRSIRHTKRLPGTATFAGLKLLIQRLHRVPVLLQRLQVTHTTRDTWCLDVIADATQTLDRLELQDGSDILVERVSLGEANSTAQALSQT